MVRLLLVLLSVLLTSIIQAQPEIGDTSVVVMTYNIRYNTPDDGINSWPLRKEKVIGLIGKEKPSLFGLQEVLIDQVMDLERAFPDHVRIGVGRDDGKDSGEFSPIFYDKSRFSLIRSGTFWLSPKPASPGSMGWDAACRRVVTWVKLADKTTGKEFCFFNTHFDHIGKLARRNSAFTLMYAVDSIAGKLPVIITGDFNATPDSEPIFIMTGRAKPWLLFTDTRKLCPGRTGPSYTYTGFEVGGLPGQLIDFVFVKHIKTVISHAVIDDHDGRYYPSDHLPVVVRLAF